MSMSIKHTVRIKCVTATGEKLTEQHEVFKEIDDLQQEGFGKATVESMLIPEGWLHIFTLEKIYEK